MATSSSGEGFVFFGLEGDGRLLAAGQIVLHRRRQASRGCEGFIEQFGHGPRLVIPFAAGKISGSTASVV
jgi:hypothetical protein